MELGMIGLGRMGGNMAERLRRAAHTVVGVDQSLDSGRGAGSLADRVSKLTAPRAVWVMVPVAGTASLFSAADSYQP
jgi:6-phosphogluconate dehydrogenase